MFTEAKITEIFYLADDFCKVFNQELRTRQFKDGKPHRIKPGRLSDSEVITILIIFHSNGFRYLKHFYKEYVCVHLRHLFPDVVSYNRFVEYLSLRKSVESYAGTKVISIKDFFDFLFMDGIQLITKIKSNPYLIVQNLTTIKTFLAYLPIFANNSSGVTMCKME